MTDLTSETSSPSSLFDNETRVAPGPAASGEFAGSLQLSSRWNIGDNPNGGYLISACVAAMAELAPQPDPVSVTAHYLRPGLGDTHANVAAQLAKPGRSFSMLRSQLEQDGKSRLEVVGVFGDLTPPASDLAPERHLEIPPPGVPGPDECVNRNTLEQGVGLPILERLDVRIIPAHAEIGRSAKAEVVGWIRHIDGRPTDARSLPLFADAFPPSVFALYGRIGWVPTIELTVHVRKRPAPGWVLARFSCDDLSGNTFIETGELWDSDGQLVARSRQLAMLLPASDDR